MRLPDPGGTTSKQERGQVLVIGGSAETPGAVLLAGIAALRAGAGKLQLATAGSARSALASAVPEARVLGLPEHGPSGALTRDSLDVLGPVLSEANAILVGTGTMDARATHDLLVHLVPEIGDATLVVDAGALDGLHDEPGLLKPLGRRAVVTPNRFEMAALVGRDVDAVVDDPEGAIDEAVERLGVVVALRDADTWVAAPDSPLYLDQSGNPGLATSGSGDVFAGVLAGLLARGVDPLEATVWAVHLHRAAGDRCAARVGVLGFIARELLDELPPAMRALDH
jgi:hydroxyethylthiazole kinase-like uncharacterized protein yjeF